MAGEANPGRDVVLETGRLLLRPWRWPKLSSYVNCGRNVIHECLRIGESTRLDIPRWRT